MHLPRFLAAPMALLSLLSLVSAAAVDFAKRDIAGSPRAGSNYHATSYQIQRRHLERRTQNPQVHILVFEGPEGRDVKKNRHTALYFTFNNAPAGRLMHITGVKGSFTFEDRPENSRDFSRIRKKVADIDLGRLKKPADEASMKAFARSVPIINNASEDFDCQKWVNEVLQKMVKEQFLDATVVNNGVSKMVDAVMDGKDRTPSPPPVASTSKGGRAKSPSPPK